MLSIEKLQEEVLMARKSPETMETSKNLKLTEMTPGVTFRFNIVGDDRFNAFGIPPTLDVTFRRHGKQVIVSGNCNCVGSLISMKVLYEIVDKDLNDIDPEEVKQAYIDIMTFLMETTDLERNIKSALHGLYMILDGDPEGVYLSIKK